MCISFARFAFLVCGGGGSGFASSNGSRGDVPRNRRLERLVGGVRANFIGSIAVTATRKKTALLSKAQKYIILNHVQTNAMSMLSNEHSAPSNDTQARVYTSTEHGPLRPLYYLSESLAIIHKCAVAIYQIVLLGPSGKRT